MNWAVFGLSVTGVVVLIWIVVLKKRRWAWPGLIASLGLLLAGAVNSAAPFRAVIDPEGFVGYGFGLISAERGLAVTLIAGSIFIVATVSALIAASRRAGPSLWIVAATCAALTVIVGFPTTKSAIEDPASNAVQFGEYFTIPGLIGSGLLLLLFTVPFVIGTLWAARAATRPA